MGITIEEEYAKYHEAYRGMFDRVMAFKTDVERREKSINDNIDYAWVCVNEENCDKVDTSKIEHYVRDIHDYEIILNELKLVKRELQKILEGE